MPASLPLDDVTVLDFTRVLAGPYCTRLMSDLGARIIKVERPGDGDDTRRGYLQVDPDRTDQSTYFIRVNAGKHSVAIDLAHGDARAVVADLVRASDVVVENFVPGVMAKLGCDYESFTAIKPDLVYCSISGFGQTGPLRHRPAFAHIIGAMSGLMHLEQDGAAHPPVAYLQAADVLAGTHAFGAIAAALVRRARRGEGAFIDVSMLQCLVAAEDVTYGSVLNGGAPAAGPRTGMMVHGIADRHMVTQFVGGPQLWARLLALMERPDLAVDPRFATPIARRENWPALRDLVGEWLDRFKTVDDALDALTAARLPCAPVLSPADVVAHPHLAAREAFADVPHPARGRVTVTATPFHLDGRALAPRSGAPYRPGEDTRRVLGDVLGYGAERIDALVRAGVVHVP